MFFVLAISRPLAWTWRSLFTPHFQSYGRYGFSVYWLVLDIEIRRESWDDFLYSRFGDGCEESDYELRD